ncbi:MAG TPA: arginine--tRNA ligase [Candidatus Saccharimonadales bacterium]|nr:arginine--tRNA ligase [Candidatus Saccharimonadales bacterium]
MQEIQTAITQLVQELFSIQTDVELTRPDEQFGDYSTNVAMKLSKQLGKNPREIAEMLAEKIRTESGAVVADVSVAGPGFLNLTLTEAALAAALSVQPAKSLAGKKWLVEYSDPNPFKPLHAGHLYTTLVGDTIARLVEHAGAETIRLNYGGDVGRHVGISMWAIVQFLGGEHPEKLADIPEAERPTWLGKRYVEGTAVFEEDEAARPEIIATNKRVYQLHAENDHESPFAQIYWTCRKWSYDYFATLYEQLQVVPFTRMIPESEITEEGIRTVREHTAGDPLNTTGSGVYVRSDDSDAVVFRGEQTDESLHTRVFINSEGIPTYEAKEVGLILEKWRAYQFDTSVVITANEQEQYMRVVLASIAKFAPEPAQRTRHLNHGIVKLQGGVKMSSRKGNVVTALEILSAAREAGEATGTNPSEETILAAVKYAFARNRIGSDIAYDPKESIALEGNSGPYLQYAHARARSILAKASEQKEVGLSGLEADERSLLRKITEYTEVIERATNELMPHHICTYLYELAQKFNQFYEHNRVIGSGEREAVRLQLVRTYADTLKNGLGLLGIAAPERM